MIVGVAILLAYAVVFFDMYRLARNVEASVWDRRKALYASVEALAFTAAGYLFGKEVHREQAHKAEQRAETKTTEAEQAKTAAADAKAKGHSLKQAIKAKQGSLGGPALETPGLEGALPERAQPQHLVELATLADSLFP